MQEDSELSLMSLLKPGTQRKDSEVAEVSSWQLRFQAQPAESSAKQAEKGRHVSFNDDTKPAVTSGAATKAKPKRRVYRKDTIIAMLRSDNDSLRTQLQQSMEENRRLRRMMAEEAERALERNRTLQLLLQQYVKGYHEQPPREQRRSTMGQSSASSSFAQPSQSLSNANGDRILTLLLAEAYHRKEHGVASNDIATDGRQQQHIQDGFAEQRRSQLVQTTRDASNASYEAVLSSLSRRGSVQGMTNPTQGLSSNDQETIRAELQLLRLQEELAALQRRLRH